LYFTAFLASVTALILYVLSGCLYTLLQETTHYVSRASTHWEEFIEAICANIVVAIILLFCIFFVLTVGNLFVFHLYLIWTNQTTNEYVKGTWQKKRNSHNAGCFTNFQHKFCNPVMSSKIKLAAGEKPVAGATDFNQPFLSNR